MGKVQEHIKRKRARGLCAHPGCKVRTGDNYRCGPHKAKHAEESRAARALKAAA